MDRQMDGSSNASANTTRLKRKFPLNELNHPLFGSMRESSLQLLDRSFPVARYFELVHSDITPLRKLKIPEPESELDKLVGRSNLDVHFIKFMIENNCLVPSNKSVILALLSKNSELYDIVYGKFKDNLNRTFGEFKNNEYSLLGTSEKNVFLESNLIDLGKFIGYYGNVDIFIKFHNDFLDYHYNDIFFEKSSLGNCICYAACAGNLDIVKLIFNHINNRPNFWYTYLSKIASTAVYYAKKDIYEFLCDNNITIRSHIMDVCIYNRNLNLLKDIYTKYGAMVSDLAVQYCMEKGMFDFVSYFISDMKIKYDDKFLDFDFYVPQPVNNTVNINPSSSNNLSNGSINNLNSQNNITYKKRQRCKNKEHVVI